MKITKKIKRWIQNNIFLPRLQKNLAKQFAKQQAALRAKFQLSHEVTELIKTLEANSYRPLGAHWLEASRILTFSNQDQMIWIQCHIDGKINRIYQEINENNLYVLADKLTKPNIAKIEATNNINAALRAINHEYPLVDRVARPIPEYIERVQGWLEEAGRVLREVE